MSLRTPAKSTVSLTFSLILLVVGSCPVSGEDEHAGEHICEHVLKALQAQYQGESDFQFERDATRALDQDESAIDKDIASARGGGSIGYGRFKLGGGGGTNTERLKQIHKQWHETNNEGVKTRLLQEFSQLVGDENVLKAWIQCLQIQAAAGDKQRQLAGLRAIPVDHGETIDLDIFWEPGAQENSPASVKIQSVEVFELSIEGAGSAKLAAGNTIAKGGLSLRLRRHPGSHAEVIVTPEAPWRACRVVLGTPWPPSPTTVPSDGPKRVAVDQLEECQKLVEFYKNFIAQDRDVAATEGVYDDRVLVTWRPFSPPNRGTVKHYDIWVTEDEHKPLGPGDKPETAGTTPETKGRFIVLPPEATSWVHDGLVRGKTYHYWLRPRWDEPGHPDKKDEDVEHLVPRLLESCVGRTRDQ